MDMRSGAARDIASLQRAEWPRVLLPDFCGDCRQHEESSDALWPGAIACYFERHVKNATCSPLSRCSPFKVLFLYHCIVVSFDAEPASVFHESGRDYGGNRIFDGHVDASARAGY